MSGVIHVSDCGEQFGHDVGPGMDSVEVLAMVVVRVVGRNIRRLKYLCFVSTWHATTVVALAHVHRSGSTMGVRDQCQ
jgi:hypothetical protein